MASDRLYTNGEEADYVCSLNFTLNVTALEGRSKAFSFTQNVLACVSMLLAIVQLLYCILHAEKFRIKESTRSKKVAQRKRKLLMDGCIVIASCFATARGVPSFFPRANQNKSCEQQRTIEISFYTTSIVFTYISLWLRQHMMYNNPALSHLSSKCTKALSFCAIFSLAVGGVLILILSTAFRDYKATKYGCISCPRTRIWEYFCLITAMAIYQIGIVALSAYPLAKHRAENNASKIRGVLRRVTSASVVCVASDVFCGLFTSISPSYEVEMYFLAYYFNLLVNILCVILSFKDWRERLFPFKMIFQIRQFRHSANARFIDMKQSQDVRESTVL